MSRYTLILLLLYGCQTNNPVDIWSSAEMLKRLSDQGEKLSCVEDHGLYLRMLWARIDKQPMPANHPCEKNAIKCAEDAKKEFCQSALFQELAKEKKDFMLP